MIEEKINAMLRVLVTESQMGHAVIIDSDQDSNEESRIVLEGDEIRGLHDILTKHFPDKFVNSYERGKATGRRIASHFPDTTLPTVCLAMLGMTTADLIVEQHNRDRYTDGFVVGFYEVNPVEPMGVSI